MTKPSKDDESYSDTEAERRRDAIVRNMIATPPTPHKTGKPTRVKRAKSKKRAPSA
jgi:hypothetical protein